MANEKKNGKAKPVKKAPRHYIRSLEVALSDKELGVSSARLAAKAQELGRVEAEKAKASAEFGSQLKGIRKEIDVYAMEVATKKGVRAIEVFDRPDLNAGVVEIVRADNKSIVETVEMSAAERMQLRQGKLPEVEGEEPPGEMSAEDLRALADDMKRAGHDVEKIDLAVSMIEEHGVAKVALGLQRLRDERRGDGGRSGRKFDLASRKRAGATELGDQVSE